VSPRELLASGHGESVHVQTVRAIIAVGMAGVLCWNEVSGAESSETFAVLMGIVIGMYFEKGTLALSTRPEPLVENDA